MISQVRERRVLSSLLPSPQTITLPGIPLLFRTRVAHPLVGSPLYPLLQSKNDLFIYTGAGER